MRIEAEEWRPVVGYEGRYEVSNTGRVKSLTRTVQRRDGRKAFIAERILRPGTTSKGYLSVTLYSEVGTTPKSYCVHYLVASAFIGARPEGYYVLHGPKGNKNNSVDNLYYGTPSDNNGKDKLRDCTLTIGTTNGNCKLNEEQILSIRNKALNGVSVTALAAEFGIAHRTVRDICTRRTWAWLKPEVSLPASSLSETDSAARVLSLAPACRRTGPTTTCETPSNPIG